MNLIINLFKPSEKFKGIWPIKVYVLKFFFLLMFALVAKDAWTEIITKEGPWNPENAIVWCVLAAYTTLSGLGIFNTLKMLPIMLFMIFYKGLWLAVVAYPLWAQDKLAGTEAAGWAQIFIPSMIPLAINNNSSVFFFSLII